MRPWNLRLPAQAKRHRNVEFREAADRHLMNFADVQKRKGLSVLFPLLDFVGVMVGTGGCMG